MVLKEKSQPNTVPFTLTESAANTFTQIEMDLPNDIETSQAFDLDLVQPRGLAEMDAAAAVQTRSLFQIARSSQSVMLSWADSAVISAKINEAMASAANTLGAAFTNQFNMDSRGRANLIAAESIFPAVNGLNQATALAVTGRIVGSLVKMSKDDLVKLLAQQLS